MCLLVTNQSVIISSDGDGWSPRLTCPTKGLEPTSRGCPTLLTRNIFNPLGFDHHGVGGVASVPVGVSVVTITTTSRV